MSDPDPNISHDPHGNNANHANLPPIDQAIDLSRFLLALRPDADVGVLPFSARANPHAHWIVGLRHVCDSASVHGDHWERHPLGDEVLCLLDGRVQVVLGAAGRPERTLALHAGQALVVPQGHWHRLHIEAPGRLLFITPSQGSEHRRVGVPLDDAPASATASAIKPVATPRGAA